jgi:hypothetical protein
MNSNALLLMERTTLALALLATGVAAAVWGVEGAGGTGLGGALAFANLWTTRRLAGRAMNRVLAGTHPAATGLGMGMAIKMALLFPVLWVAVMVLHVPLMPFALGLSVLVISLVGSGLYSAAKGEAF